jgi:tRNA G18 (ribose-2'-O)-methylase SpoU
MAQLVEVDDPLDPRLADYRDLRDVQLRQSLEAEHGLFLAEGEKVVRRAVQGGFPVRSFLMAPRWLDGLRDVIEPSDAPCYVVSEDLAEEVTGFHVHRGALASLARLPLPSVEELLSGASTVVVVEDVVDHTNIGAIFRSAAALDVDAVLLSPRAADPLYRRSVKVGMGAVFSVPWTRIPDWYAALPSLSEAGFTTVALTLAPDAVPLEEAVADLPKVALVLGSEGHGLSPRWEQAADRRAVIPMRDGIDSLNVAAATAVACSSCGAGSQAGFTGWPGKPVLGGQCNAPQAPVPPAQSVDQPARRASSSAQALPPETTIADTAGASGWASRAASDAAPAPSASVWASVASTRAAASISSSETSTKSSSRSRSTDCGSA